MSKTNIKLALVAGVLVGMLGCNATVAPAPVETVGQLAPSYRSIAVAPVHASTDLTPGFQAIDTDEAPKAEAVVEPAQAPEVVKKTGGLVVGEGRE